MSEEAIPTREYDFHFLGGRPSLDFAATVGERWLRSFERLRTDSDLARWLAESGLLPTEPEVGTGLLDRARELREAIYRVGRPGAGEPLADDIAEINAWAALPGLVPHLSEDAACVSWSAPDPAEAALAMVARDAIDLFAGPLAGRIRECAADDCALIFVDASRPGKRRWCSMEGCGNRTKTRAYRRRKAVA